MKIEIINAAIWDGSGADAYTGSLTVEDDRISSVQAEAYAEDPRDRHLRADYVIDAAGRTVMPGLVEGHAHLSFGGASKNSDLGEIPPEEHTLLTMRNAELLLDHGFTSAYSAASAKMRLDVVIRDEIDAGRLKGPRIRAAGPEITVTGGLGDENKLHMSRDSFGLVADGPEAIAKAVRTCIREGVDNVKIVVSGDDFVDAKGAMTVMSEQEIRAAVQAAHSFNRRVSCHARAGESVKRAVRCGADVIYHCESADEEALDLLEQHKDHIFVGPAIGLIHNTLYEAEDWGITFDRARDMGIEKVMEASQQTYAEIRKRGIRALIGGDYGFGWVPQGTNARDIEHFVKLFGYSPAEALQCATRIGGELMGLDQGLLAPGYLADLLVVDGDPVQDLSILQHISKLPVVVKNGAIHRNELGYIQSVNE